MAADSLFSRQGLSIVHEAIPGSESPEWRSSHFEGRLAPSVLDYAITGPDIVEQEVRIGMDDLVAKRSRDDICSAICGSSRSRRVDVRDVADGAADLAEELTTLTGIRGLGKGDIW